MADTTKGVYLPEKCNDVTHIAGLTCPHTDATMPVTSVCVGYKAVSYSIAESRGAHKLAFSADEACCPLVMLTQSGLLSHACTHSVVRLYSESIRNKIFSLIKVSIMS